MYIYIYILYYYINFCLFNIFDYIIIGFYHDRNIMSCDSLLGICLFVFTSTIIVYTILGYFYIFYSFISLVSAEFKKSKFVDILGKLIRIREDEEQEFMVRMWVLLVFYCVYYGFYYGFTVFMMGFIMILWCLL